MGLNKLNDRRVTRARVTLPDWGCWYAEAEIDEEAEISGLVTLAIADLTLKGTILSGGPKLGNSVYRIVGGYGGWGRTLKRFQYANDAGVKVSKVLTDVAQAAGERLGTVSTTQRLGSHWARPEGPGRDVLELVAPQGWYVDEAGVTQIGRRAARTLPAGVTRIAPLDKARGKIVLASESIASILPGVVVDGMTAIDVIHEVTEDGLRSTVWGQANGGALESMRKVIEALDPDRKFRGVTEYRVVTQEGDRLNLQPERKSTGMPELRRVPVRPGVAGCKWNSKLGARVLVGFVDSDPARPYVAGVEEAAGAGFTPTLIEISVAELVTINGAASFVARADKVDARLDTIQSTFDAHVHPTGVGPSGPPVPIGPLDSTACTTLKLD
jgi:hypothetical protein